MKKSAFSLVELSIVLVILGLLTGGILTGQSLIRAAELRSVTTELQNHRTSLRTFQSKYLALPGDMRNAVRFWGAQAGGTTDGIDSTCAALDHTSPATGTATCNGDGNGLISTCGSDCHERFRAYQHLANAGLIEGTYTGVRGSGGNKHSVIGQNVPASKLSNGGWTLFYFGTRSGHASFFDNNYRHAYWFGAQDPTFETAGDLLTPEEVWGIDRKVDDATPGSGFVLERKRNTDNLCTTTADHTTAEYDLDTTSNECMLIIKAGY